MPPGFAVTIQASSLALLRPSGLFKKIHSTLCKVDADVPHSLQDAARTVQNLILEAPLPEEVEKALLDGWDEAFGKDSQVQAALRSSAVDEDGVQSFAGQYLSILGVTRESLPTAFKRVLASLFSPRALAYRARTAIRWTPPAWACAVSRWCRPRRPAWPSPGIPWTCAPTAS